MTIDNNTYKEIGELSSDKESVVIGNVKNKKNSYKNKSLLSPDSDRLLYNYSSDVLVRDYDVTTSSAEFKEKQIFVGKNILTIYDTENGNFYIENPKKIINKLVKLYPSSIRFTDIEKMCENLKTVNVVDQKAYILTSKFDGENVLFSIDLYTYEVSLIEEIGRDIGSDLIYCKPFDFNKRLRFIVKSDSGLVVWEYNTVNGDWSNNTSFATALQSFYTAGADKYNSIVAFKDSINSRIIFVSTVNEGSVKVYDYGSNSTGFTTVVDADLNIGGATIKQSAFYKDANSRTNQTSIAILLDNNKMLFLGLTKGASNYTVSSVVYTFKRTYGIIGFAKVLSKPNTYGFYIVVKTSEGKTSAIYLEQNEIITSIEIDVMSRLDDVPAFLKSLSEEVEISNNIFTHDTTNLLLGSYTEGGAKYPLIKDFGTTVSETTTAKNRMFRTVMSKDSNVSLVKGLSYSDTQMSRVRLYPETILNDSSLGGTSPETVVSFKENDKDKTEYTSGEYLWKILKSTGMPYNTHVEAVGRIVVEGFDIPIEKVMITKANGDDTCGDVLFTFDKLFDIGTINEALSEDMSQYPGVLFFKNNGFLQDAVISNSHLMSGTLFYDDSESNKLFSRDVVSVVCNCRLDDGKTLLIGTNFGGIASVNIQTGGYMSTTGTGNGDDYPLYYRSTDDFNTYGSIVGIVQRRNRIYAIYSSGAVFKTTIGSNEWVNVKPIETDEDIHLRKCYFADENLLLVSSKNGQIYKFDMDTNRYVMSKGYKSTDISSNYLHYEDSDYNFALGAISNQCSRARIGHKHYFIADSFSGTGPTNKICYYDTKLRVIGCLKNHTVLSGAMLISDEERYLYILSNKDGTSNKFYRYDTFDDEMIELANLPSSNLTRSGGYIKGNNIYIPFGMISSSWYILEYNIPNNTWMTYKINTTIDSYVVDGCFFEYEDSNGDRHFAQLYGKKNISNRTATPSETTLTPNVIDINVSMDDVENAITINNDFTKDSTYGRIYRYGCTVSYDKINKSVIIGPGSKYAETGTISTDYERYTYQIYNIDGTYIKHGGWDSSYYYGDNRLFFYEDGKAWLPLTSDGKVAEIVLRTNAPAVFNRNMLLMTYDKTISSIITINNGVMIFSYSDGTILSSNNSVELSDISTVKVRSPYDIFAKPGEFSRDGAHTIKQIGDDVYFLTPTHTFRFSTKIGCFFLKNDKKFLDKTDDYIEKQYMTDPYTRRHIAGSSKVVVDKYIIFMNGYDSSSSSGPTSSNTLRSIVAYDTETGEFAMIGEGKNDTDVDGTIDKKYNAYSYYRDGYIYTFSGNNFFDEIQADGSIVKGKCARLGHIERYDLLTGEIILLNGETAPGVTKVVRTISDDLIRTETDSNGLSVINSFAKCSQNKWLSHQVQDNTVDKDRYIISMHTANDVNDVSPSVNVEYRDSSNAVTSTEVCGNVCIFVFDTYTEKSFRYYARSTNKFPSEGTMKSSDVIGGETFGIDGNKILNLFVERFKDGECDLYCVTYKHDVKTISIRKLKLLEPTTDGWSPCPDFDDVSVPLTVNFDTRHGICQPFYDEKTDSIVIPFTKKGPTSTDTEDIIYSFKTNSWFSYRSNLTGSLNWDTGSTPLCRILPNLEVKGKRYLVDDINCEIREVPVTDYSAVYCEEITRTPLLDLFLSSKKDVDPRSLGVTDIVNYKDHYYKAVLIYKTNTDYDDIPELGIPGKTRFAILRLDVASREINVVSLDYPTGAWSTKTDIFMTGFVCNDMIWFTPKIGTVAEQNTSALPNVIFSYNPDDLSLTKHSLDGDKISSGLPKTNVIVDEDRDIVHFVYCNGGNASTGYGLSDIKLVGLNKLAHANSNPISVELRAEAEPSNNSVKAIPIGRIENNKVQLVISLHDDDYESHKIGGVIFKDLTEDGDLFEIGESVTTKLFDNSNNYYKPNISSDFKFAGNKIYVRTSEENKCIIYDTGLRQIATFTPQKGTSLDGTYLPENFAKTTMISDDGTVTFVFDNSGNKILVTGYKVSDIPEHETFKSLNWDTLVKNVVSRDNKLTLTITKSDFFRKCGKESIFLYSKAVNKLFKYSIKNRELIEFLDMSTMFNDDHPVTGMSVSLNKVALFDDSKIYIIDIATRYLEKTIDFVKSVSSTCINAEYIFIYSDTDNKVYRVDTSSDEIETIVTLDDVTLSKSYFEINKDSNFATLGRLDTSKVLHAIKFDVDGNEIFSNNISNINLETAVTYSSAIDSDKGLFRELGYYENMFGLREFSLSSGLNCIYTDAPTAHNLNLSRAISFSTGLSSVSFVDNDVYFINNEPVSTIVYGKPLDVSSESTIAKIDYNDKVFSYDGTLYKIETASNIIRKLNGVNWEIVADMSQSISGRIIYCFAEASGLLKLVTVSKQDSENLIFNYIVYSLVNKSSTLKSFVVSGFSNISDDFETSVSPIIIGNNFITSIISRTTVDGYRYPYSVKLDLTNRTTFVERKTSASDAIKSLKGLDSLQFIGEDVISVGGITTEVTSGIPTSASGISASKKVLNENVSYETNSNITGSQVSTNNNGMLIKNGKYALTSVGGWEERLVNSAGNNISDPIAINVSTAGSSDSTTVYHPFNGQYTLFENEDLSVTTENEARNPPKYVPLEGDKILVQSYKYNGKANRIIRLPKSPVAQFAYGEYGVKIYSGSTSDLFVSYSLETGEIIDKMNVERGYGISISCVSESDTDVVFVFYENSPNISSLIIHEDGSLSLKLFNGKIYGKDIGESDNSISIQELDLTLLFDEESSELGMR